MFLILLIPGLIAFGLLVWSSLKLIRQIRAKVEPTARHIVFVGIGLAVIAAIFCMGILIFTGLGHSECLRRQGEIACILTVMVIVVLPVAGLLMSRHYLISVHARPVQPRSTAIKRAKAVIGFSALTIILIIIYLLGKIEFWPPLMFAVKIGNQQTTAFLLSLGVDGNARDLCGRAPLPYAALIKDVGMVKLLVERGIDMNSEDEHGMTALVWAVAHGNIDLVNYLLNMKARVNVPRGHPMPLAFAVTGDVRLVHLLLNRGARVNDSNAHGTALTDAARANRTEVVKILMAYGADPNIKSASGRTPLMEAAWGGFLEVVKVLLENGADPSLKDDQRNTALILARQRGHAMVIEALEAFSTSAGSAYESDSPRDDLAR